MEVSEDGRRVPVVQAYAFGKYLGFLKVTFDDDGNVVRSTGNPILLDSSIQQGTTATSCLTTQLPGGKEDPPTGNDGF